MALSLPSRAAALAARTRSAGRRAAARHYNFGSSEYLACFGDLPVPDGARLRRDAVAYVEGFDGGAWRADPATTLVGDEALTDGDLFDTFDAFGDVNGAARAATEAELRALSAHVAAWDGPRDGRGPARAAEADLFGAGAARLIGDQALDFRKQDGVTELEESLQASAVERRLTDALLADEAAGRVVVSRAPVFVACVSNFSNFLDLSRKALRSLDVGAPVVVLSRASGVSTQHGYRWAAALRDALAARGGDRGAVSYACCGLEQQLALMAAFPEGPLHITCGRGAARAAVAARPNVVASTGGPNTLWAPAWTPEVAGAVAASAAIEHAGQCTALRHAVVGGATAKDVAAALRGVGTAPGPGAALAAGAFPALLAGAPRAAPPPGYEAAGAAAFAVRENLPRGGLDEHWRRVVVDVTAPADAAAPGALADLAAWVNEHQPIALAVNCAAGDLGPALALFEATALVVYTVGVPGAPALTCQARPQEGEVFGEVPPRRDLYAHTRFPVLVPSAAAAYSATYARAHLEASAGAAPPAAAPLVAAATSRAARGYAALVAAYVADCCARGPARGGADRGGGPGRSVLFGVQRPPLASTTVLRCDAATTYDDLLPSLVPFETTTARDECVVAVDPANAALLAALDGAGVRARVVAADDAAFAALAAGAYNVVPPDRLGVDADAAPLVQQFVSRLLPMGHVKSTTPDDAAFFAAFEASPKWLRLQD